LALGVFGQHVVFQVHKVAGFEVAEVCLLKGVGDDPEAEKIFAE
jgi:hypothetical protein